MKQVQRLVSLLVIALAVVSSCLPNPPLPKTPPLPSTAALSTPLAAPSAIPPSVGQSTLVPATGPQFDAHRAFEFNQMLAVAIGTRVAGSESGFRARDYIAQQLADAGFAVEKQAFPFQAWEDRGTTVEQVSPQSRSVDALPIQYSPAGTVQAEVQVVRGNGTADDFANSDVKGKIALVARGTIPFSDKAKNAAASGALAVLIYNNTQGGFTGTLKDPVSIPTLGITGEDGRAILDELAHARVSIKIASDTLVAEKTGYNVVGRLQGASDDTFLLGGHYDSVQAGPGANDNGSGAAVLLELARDLGKTQHKHSFVVVAFDGEEFGLLGSRYYAGHLSSTDRNRLKGMLNFDMLAGGSGPLLLGGEGQLGTSARNVASQMGIVARDFELGGNAGSDHESFQQIGVDTVFFSRDYNLLHTPQDKIDQVKEDWLGEAGRVAIRLVYELDGESTP